MDGTMELDKVKTKKMKNINLRVEENVWKNFRIIMRGLDVSSSEMVNEFMKNVLRVSSGSGGEVIFKISAKPKPKDVSVRRRKLQ